MLQLKAMLIGIMEGGLPARQTEEPARKLREQSGLDGPTKGADDAPSQTETPKVSS